MGDTETIVFDERDWPLMVIRFSGQPSDAEFSAYLQRYEDYLARSQRYGLVMITEPNAPMTKPKHARMQAEWIKEHYARLGERCAGLAFVLPSPVMRGVLKAILSMQRLPAPHAVYASEDEAREWVRGRLDGDRFSDTGS